MNTAKLLTTVQSPTLIRDYLNQHMSSRAPVKLIVQGCTEPLLAKITALRPSQLAVQCLIAPSQQRKTPAAYSLVGKLRNGSRFMASGKLDMQAESAALLHLTFPKWVDVSQSRESFRCAAPSGYFLHLSAAEPHLNDIVCKLHNISFDGLAFEWPNSVGDPHQMLHDLNDNAILMARSSECQLGKLRVVHVTRVDHRTVVGCALVTKAPAAFDSAVMQAQRSMRVLT